MSRYSSSKRNRTRAASLQAQGGYLSVPLFPLIAFLALSAMFIMATGETTQPWEVNQSPEPVKTGGIAPLFSVEVQFWEKDIIRWAKAWDLDPNLVATVMQIESCGDPKALSPAGAMGLFQVMPYHFAATESPFKPNTNAKRGLAYLKQSLDTYRNIRLALAGYNGGISTAGKPESMWKAETIRYVYWGTNIYKDALKGKRQSPTLNEWISAGGASLCAQARQRLGIFP